MACIPTININLNLPILSIPKALLSFLGKLKGFINGIVSSVKQALASIIGILKNVVDKFKEGLKALKNLIPTLIKSLKGQFNFKNLKDKLKLNIAQCDVFATLTSKMNQFLGKYSVGSFRDLLSKMGMGDFSKIVNSVLNVDSILSSKLMEVLGNIESFAKLPSLGGIASISFQCTGSSPTLGSGYYEDFLSTAGLEMPQLKIPACNDGLMPCAWDTQDKLKDALDKKRKQDVFDDINKNKDLGILKNPILDLVSETLSKRYTLKRNYFFLDENNNVVISENKKGVEDITITTSATANLSSTPVSGDSGTIVLSGGLTFEGTC